MALFMVVSVVIVCVCPEQRRVLADKINLIDPIPSLDLPCVFVMLLTS